MTTPKRHARTLGALPIAVVLALSASACATDTNNDPEPEPPAVTAASPTGSTGSNGAETLPETSTSPGAATTPAATEWQVDDTVDAQVALMSFSQQEVAGAVETVKDATTEFAFNDDLIRDTTPTTTELSGITKYMTTYAADYWRTITTRYASGEATDRERVSIALLAYPNIHDHGYRVQKTGPAALNQKIDDIVVTTEMIDGHTDMKVTETVTADVRLTHKGTNVVSHVKKTVVFYMRSMHEHGKKVWKINGYTGRLPASAQSVTPEV